MARRVETYIVPDEGRDKGKRFSITEMSAVRAESWATRMLLGIFGTNPELPEGIESFEQLKGLGMAGVAQFGLKALAGLKYETLKPLLDEMMDCIQYMPDPRHVQVTRPIIEDDIEEVVTLLNLRKEVWNIHTGFLQAVTPSIFGVKETAEVFPKRHTKMSRN